MHGVSERLQTITSPRPNPLLLTCLGLMSAGAGSVLPGTRPQRQDDGICLQGPPGTDLEGISFDGAHFECYNRPRSRQCTRAPIV
jgi:hypothetical protein